MKFYRYEDREIYDRGIKIQKLTFQLEKETPCGYWITDGYNQRWISKTSRKRYAYPTKEEAYANFIARKKRQIEHLERQLDRATKALRVGESIDYLD